MLGITAAIAILEVKFRNYPRHAVLGIKPEVFASQTHPSYVEMSYHMGLARNGHYNYFVGQN